MPKGLKRALAAAHRRDSVDEDDDPDDTMMELRAARQIMEEQQAAREASQQGADGQVQQQQQRQHVYNKAGLEQMTEQLTRNLPWPETLDTRGILLELEDAHDDLQREVAFYNNALAAVKLSKERLKAEGIPYKRPPDFLCEMMKSDAHMAKIKDKLIFEQQKMDAFQQRKDRTDQRKYAKEVNAEKLKEKAAKKKEALDAVAQWRKDQKAKGGSGGALPDDDGLDAYLSGKKRPAPGKDGGGPNKRAAKDKKFGHGGVPGRLKKAATPKSINDMRGFNPKKGKTTARKGKPNAGANRPGKSSRAKKRAKK